MSQTTKGMSTAESPSGMDMTRLALEVALMRQVALKVASMQSVP